MVKPKAYVSVPVTPATVYVNKTFVTYGYLKPRHIAGTLPAKMRFYRWGRNASGVNAWVLKKTVDAKAYDYSTYSKCCSWTSLPSTGSWKVELYHATDAGNNAAVSESRYFSVK
jgi:hypothetical protein